MDAGVDMAVSVDGGQLLLRLRGWRSGASPIRVLHGKALGITEAEKMAPDPKELVAERTLELAEN